MPRKKTRPRKPAKHTGVLIFPKSGPVTKIVQDWPRTQEQQDLRVVEMFVTTMVAWHDRHLENVQPLPESAHDIVAIEAGARTEIQVTELVTKDVLRDLGGAFGWTEGDFDDLFVRAILKRSRALEFCESSRSDRETGTRRLHVPGPLQIAQHTASFLAQPVEVRPAGERLPHGSRRISFRLSETASESREAPR